MKAQNNINYIHTTPGKNDECYTERYAVEPLLEFLEPFKDSIIWCPFDKEESEFVKVFKENGFKVVYSHIDEGKNFFNYEPEEWDIMISNPPFTNKREIFERALSFGKPFALIMTLTWLNDRTPMKIFKNRNFQLLMFEDRMNFKGQANKAKQISFSSAYFCCDFLPQQILIRDFKNQNQMKLFKGVE